MRPPPPLPTQKTGRPQRLKKIKWLEKKKCNLENQIQKNPNNKKAINQLKGMLKQLRLPQPTGQTEGSALEGLLVPVPKPKITNELALRKRMVWTGRPPYHLGSQRRLRHQNERIRLGRQLCAKRKIWVR